MKKGPRRGLLAAATVATTAALVIGTASSGMAFTYGYYYGQLSCSPTAQPAKPYPMLSATVRGDMGLQFGEDSSGNFYVEYDYHNGSSYVLQKRAPGQNMYYWGTIGFNTPPITYHNWACQGIRTG